MNSKDFPFQPIVIIAAFNVLLLLVLFLIFCSSLSRPAGYEIRMPKAIVSEGLQKDQTIVVTAENVLYLNNKAMTLNELKKELSKIDFKYQNIFIRIDRRSSMDRVMDIWDLCRALGGNRVHIIAGEKD